MKTQVLFLAVSKPKFMSFRDGVGDLLWLPTHLPIVYIIFCSEDIGRQTCLLATKSSKIGPQFLGPQIFAGWRLQTFLRQFVTVVYSLLSGKVWLSSMVLSVCEPPCLYTEFQFWSHQRLI